jgi:transposase
VSPYDVEARWSDKRTTSWVGYKVHLTETADDDGPVLITNVESTMATLPDAQALPAIHESLRRHDLLPNEHLLDAGYVDSIRLVDSQQTYAVTLVGHPARHELTSPHRRSF